MGRTMARALRSAGFAVRGWNRTPLAPELVDGIPVCADLGQAEAADSTSAIGLTRASRRASYLIASAFAGLPTPPRRLSGAEVSRHS